MTLSFAERLRSMSEVELRVEAERLHAAKRNALKVADELAKENVELRTELERLRKEARRAKKDE